MSDTPLGRLRPEIVVEEFSKLEAEIARLQEYIRVMVEKAADQHRPAYDEQQKRIMALTDEIERLEIALVRYGHHDNECPVLSSTTVTACECGYRAALARGTS